MLFEMCFTHILQGTVLIGMSPLNIWTLVTAHCVYRHIIRVGFGLFGNLSLKYTMYILVIKFNVELMIKHTYELKHIKNHKVRNIPTRLPFYHCAIVEMLTSSNYSFHGRIYIVQYRYCGVCLLYSQDRSINILTVSLFGKGIDFLLNFAFYKKHP